MADRTTRRTFLKQAAATAAVPFIITKWARAQGANERLRIAFIATGGMGGAHIGEMEKLGQDCPCYCDVDTDRMGGAAERWPRAKAYQDYRKMLDAEHKNIDGVMIGTPDHSHFPATAMAMGLGVHVYTQKPLTQTVWEARQLAKLAKRHPRIVTQMGNQGHAGDDWRILYEWIHSGAIGDVTEVHTWTNRPIWPQGIRRPLGRDSIPASLNWDCWIGPAKTRPFKGGVYHPFAWRGFWEFGAGALGDMACHTMDGMFWSLDPGTTCVTEPVEVNGKTRDCFPNSSIIKWEFPKRDDRPAFVQYWYDGGLKPQRPANLEQGRELPGTGNLFVGTKGTLIIPGDYGGGLETIPQGLKDEVGTPPKLLERSIGHYKEWVEAIKGNGKTVSNFGYAGPMTEVILLGNVACRLGKRLEYDGDDMKIRNEPDANELLTRRYRKGWDDWA